MSANITINFGGGAATSNSVELVLSNGAISVSPQQGVSIAMASALTNVTVVANQVRIATAFGAPFNGSLVVAIDWAAGQLPAVTLVNLTGPLSTVTWPTASGPQTQNLTPGDPMVLMGIVGSPA